MFGVFTLRSTASGLAPVDPLNKFSLEGEGGYESYAYTFVDRGKAYFDATEKNAYIKPMLSNDSLIKTLVLGTYTYYYLENVLKIASGNENKVILFRDGSVDTGGARTSFPWIADNLTNIADIFCPSNYSGNLIQLFSMKTGELYAVDCKNKTTTLLDTNVDRMVCKNPSHACDILYSKYNGDVHHAWVTNSGGNLNSGEPTGTCQVAGLKFQDLAFASIADNPWGAFICYKDDRRTLYRLTTDANGRHLGVQAAAYDTLTDTAEYYLHAQGNEFHTVVLSNKKIYDYHDRLWNNTGHYRIVEHNFTTGIRISTPTSYSMMIEATDGYWFMDQTGTGSGHTGYGLNAPIKYGFYQTLVDYLLPLRS